MVTKPTMRWWLRPSNRALFEMVLGLLNDPKALTPAAHPESRIDRSRSTTAMDPVSDRLREREHADG